MVAVLMGLIIRWVDKMHVGWNDLDLRKWLEVVRWLGDVIKSSNGPPLLEELSRGLNSSKSLFGMK